MAANKFDLGKFLKETYNRLFTGESPYYYRIIQRISSVCGTLAGVPVLLAEMEDKFKITVPDWINTPVNKYVFIAALVAFVLSRTFKKEVVPSKMPLTDQ